MLAGLDERRTSSQLSESSSLSSSLPSTSVPSMGAADITTMVFVIVTSHHTRHVSTAGRRAASTTRDATTIKQKGAGESSRSALRLYSYCVIKSRVTLHSGNAVNCRV